MIRFSSENRRGTIGVGTLGVARIKVETSGAKVGGERTLIEGGGGLRVGEYEGQLESLECEEATLFTPAINPETSQEEDFFLASA